jgi:hypothetical protein
MADQDCSGYPALELTPMDRNMWPAGHSVRLAYNAIPEEDLLIAGLKRVIAQSPWLAGRMIAERAGDAPLLVANNAGVLFTTSSRSEPMPSYSPGAPFLEDADAFIVHEVRDDDFDHHTPLLQIKLTRFSNGATIGATIPHIFGDGAALFGFLSCWSNAVAGNSCEPLDFDRGLFEGRRSAAASSHGWIMPRFSHFTVDTAGLATRVFRISGELVDHLESGGQERHRGLRHELVTATVWKAVVGSQRCAADAPVSLSVLYNARKYLGLPKGYFGNAATGVVIGDTRGHVAEVEVHRIAKEIRSSAYRLDAESIHANVEQMARLIRCAAQGGPEPVEHRIFSQGGTIINNVSSFNYYGLDFGASPPIFVDIPELHACRRSVFLFGAPERDGGIVAHVTLPADEMQRFALTAKRWQHSPVDMANSSRC